jgi:hypothetical protein
MGSLLLLARMCEVTNILSDIVKTQQEAIEQSHIEENIKEGFRHKIFDCDKELDSIEFNLRRYCDTDDVDDMEGKNYDNC